MSLVVARADFEHPHHRSGKAPHRSAPADHTPTLKPEEPVYAACRARVPFAAFRLYNHKITGLLEWAGVEIPIATNLAELVDAIEFAKENRPIFETLFDWMESRPVWPGLRAD